MSVLGHRVFGVARFAQAATGCSWLVRLAIVLLLAPMLRAEDQPTSANYLISVWQTEDGLPDNSVTSIQQTPDGYLWIGTYNGLARFDGVRFVTFDPNNTPALTHPRVQRLFVDAAGTLWIHTFDASLTAFRKGQFTLEHRGSASQSYAARSFPDQMNGSS